MIKLPTSDTPPSSRIADNNKYRQYFTDCLGALDSIHINVSVELMVQLRYQNQKGHLS